MFPMRCAPRKAYYLDVTITPEVRPQINAKLFEEAKSSDPILKSMVLAYDGRHIAVSLAPLKGMVSITIGEQKESKTGESEIKGKAFTMVLKNADMGAVDLGSPEQARKDMQAIDIIVRYASSLKLSSVGRGFYDPNAKANSITGGAELWFGHVKTVKATQAGLLLNTDISVATMVEPLPIIEFVCQKLGVKNVSQLVLPQDLAKIKKAVSHIKVRTSHAGQRTWRIADVANQPSSHEKFMRDEKEISVQQYFAEQYKITLKYPFLPCLRLGMGKLVSMPMELCVIEKGQRYFSVLNAAQRAEMVEQTCYEPRMRNRMILQAMDEKNSDEVLHKFGLSVGKEMVTAPARILDAPSLSFPHEKDARTVIVTPDGGQWTFRDLKVNEGAVVAKYAIITMVPGTVKDFERWMGGLVKQCNIKGIKLNSKMPAVLDWSAVKPSQFEAQMVQISNAKNELVFFLLPNDKHPSYREIKRIGDTVCGMRTQCLDWAKIRDQRKSGIAYLNNICLKLNAKLGAANFVLQNDLSSIWGPLCMVMGADVHHPPAGNAVSPSIACVVASFEKKIARYNTWVEQQRHRLECIEKIGDSTEYLLRQFAAKNQGQYPKKIIMFRDGVGESYFEGILGYELKHIKDACLRVNAKYNPEITFIIVQKRNKVKLFPQAAKQANPHDTPWDRSGNCLPGTIVDSHVTSPDENDFFLLSHAALKGMSCPTHYHVLYDDSRFNADQLHAMTYALCHMYQRCFRTVSIPAPAYWAHLGAYRARLYPQADEEGDYRLDTPNQIAEKFMAAKVKTNLQASMYYG